MIKPVEYYLKTYILKIALPAIVTIAFICVLGLFCEANAEISEPVAVNCILGEIRGDYAKFGYTAFLAQAEALRNRGKTQGVYGCNANFLKEMPFLKAKGIYNQAVKAWRESAHTNLVKGADHWGSTIVDKAWINKMERNGFKLTYKIGHHAYYRKD